MKILYGVMGEGLGHAMRAQVIAGRLRAEGHELLLCTSGRAVGLLRAHGFEVVEIAGLELAYAPGEVLRSRTLARNLAAFPRRLRQNLAAPLARVRDVDPDLVITDFESFSHFAGRLLKKPTVSLDHQHVVSMFRHPRPVRSQLSREFPLTVGFVGAKTPRCEHYIVSSFFFPTPKARHVKRASLVGPIVRPAVAAARPSRGRHVVVYQTASGSPALFDALVACPSVPFVIYGSAGQAAPRADNLQVRPFSEAGFIADLASARAVISNGGFTALAEAIYLGKPVYALPLAHQPEQQLNAVYLAELGRGAYSTSPTADGLRRFLERLDDFSPTDDPRLRTGADDACRALRQVMEAA